MAQDTQYGPIPFVYRSLGVIARDITDQAPEYTYLNLLNCLEREENAMSSRYGTTIINRDPTGTGTSNYYFTSPVTTISRLTYQSNAWRYAGLSDGTLWRRAGNMQGAYTGIYTGLSGDPFDSVVTNCYESAQPYLFIYDKAASIKDSGTGTPELTGIDPSPWTANAVPYSPLLTMIDNFAEASTYGTENVTSWAWGLIETLTADSSQTVTDFPEFFGISGGGGSYTPSSGVPATATYTQAGTGSGSSTSGVISGFPSVVIGSGETITVSLTFSGSNSTTPPNGEGGGGTHFEYSPDGGSTWVLFFASSPFPNTTFGPYMYGLVPSGVANLADLQFRVVASAGSGGPTPPTVVISGTISAASAVVSSSGVLANICNGIVSNLSTNTIYSAAIVSIEQTGGMIGGLYYRLVVTTSTPHGLGVDDPVAIYGTSNALVDGFYYIVAAPSSTTLEIDYISSVSLTAIGGIAYGVPPTPQSCVLANEYDNPYPTQFSAWGFYSEVPLATTSFPVGAWSGTVAASTTATINKTAALDLSLNNAVTDDDLIVIVLKVGSPDNISNIRLQFDVNGSVYTSSYYYKDIAPAYYQGNVANTVAAYDATEQQILADTLGLITGAPPNTTTAQLQPGNFSTGSDSWVAVYLRRGDFLPVGNAGDSGLDWINISGWQIIVDTNSSGSSSIALNGIYLQWGYGPSSFGGVGYDYRYSYYDAATGTESNGSPIQTFNEQWGYLSSLAAPIFLRQAVQVTGVYSSDTQVTHLRIYRRGGIYADNWRLIDQVPNITDGGTFFYKDVIADASIAQASTLALDNDPPVTSTLQNPINTTLSVATAGPGNTIYSTYTTQNIQVSDGTATFVPEQVALIGNANNLEIVRVVTGGTGQFTAIVRLQHNAGEPVLVSSIPRQPCNLCALSNQGGVIQVYLAGDPNNPHLLYYSKAGYPENFGPQNYIAVSSPDDPINAVINWRGTIIVGTLKTWYIIIGGARPYAQPTGSQHGIIAQNGWVEVEGAIWYQANDGLREFTGADGAYMTLPIEWIFRNNSLSQIPLVDTTELSQNVMAYYNNVVYTSYISQNDGQRYRINYDRVYKRFRNDDVAATAMFWEKDLGTFLVGKEIGSGNYAVVQDQVYTQDYDDGGWVSAALVETPIALTIRHPYRDLGQPHFPKQWNVLETDINTQNQVLNTSMLFDDGSVVLTLATANTGTVRKKVQLTINDGDGQEAYRASIQHQMSVTVAPILYQENIYAAKLASYTASLDTYWIKFNIDESKFVKEGYFDYTSTQAITVNLYADNNTDAYFTFQLPAQTKRYVQRVRFGNLNNGTTAFTLRTWRMVMTVADPTNPFRIWTAIRASWKPIGAGHTYQVQELQGE